MAQTPHPERASFLSTGVVSRALGLEPAVLRAMIEAGTLPEPQWISSGNSVERAYPLEWMLLAGEQLNLRRLPGMEYAFESPTMVHLAVRFEQENWTLDEVSRKLTALNALWALCATTLGSGTTAEAPTLVIRRLSAGSPLDLLAWANDNWGGVVGTGAIAAVFTYLIKNPSKVAEAIPRMLAVWRENWARADDAKVTQLKARINRERFEEEANAILRELNAVPSETALSGPKTSRLELISLDASSAIDPSDSQGSERAAPPAKNQ